MTEETKSTIIGKTVVSRPWEAWRDDRLERFRLAAYLNTVISSISHPFVINLSAPYGTGKTFFLRNWQRQLLDEGGRVAYLNANQAEISGDPFVALSCTLRDQVFSDPGERYLKDYDALMDRASPFITRKHKPIVTNAHDQAKSQILHYGDIMGSMNSFRSELVQLVASMGANQPDPRRRKIILLIDELDRCRPSYLLEMLECLRHLFLVPGIITVLAADQVHMRNVISGIYGGEAGGEGYLRKFIDWELTLPAPSYKVFAKHLYSVFRIEEAGVFISGRDPFRGDEHLIEGFAFFADLCKLTLRQQHHCFMQINIVARALKAEGRPFGFLLGALTALRMAYGGEISRFCNGQRPINELIHDFEEDGMEKIGNHLRIGWHDFKARFHAWFLTPDEENILKSELKELQNEIKSMIESRVMNSRELPLKNRIAYLDSVLKTYHAVRKDSAFAGDESPAQSVFRDLEKGMFLADSLNVSINGDFPSRVQKGI